MQSKSHVVKINYNGKDLEALIEPFADQTPPTKFAVVLYPEPNQTRFIGIFTNIKEKWECHRFIDKRLERSIASAISKLVL